MGIKAREFYEEVRSLYVRLPWRLIPCLGRLKEAIQLLTLPFSSQQDDLPACDVLMKALADTKQLELVQSTLAKLGIEVLSNSEIRDVLRRRNDMLYSWN